MKVATSAQQSRIVAGQRVASPHVARLHGSVRKVRQAVCSATPEKLTGMVFEPFNEVKLELANVDKTDESEFSFARTGYHPECEAAINEQINVEYNISYVYHSLYAFFDRDNVGLPGMAEFFKGGSEEEREHAQKLMEFQNMRGGRVKLEGITAPVTDFNHVDKGDALYAMELSLAMEKLNFQKLRQLHDVASKHNDAQMTDFIEGELLEDQVEDIKKVAEYVSQLRRIGKGHGVYHFDLQLQNQN